jgi:hypothetical protein
VRGFYLVGAGAIIAHFARESLEFGAHGAWPHWIAGAGLFVCGYGIVSVVCGAIDEVLK